MLFGVRSACLIFKPYMCILGKVLYVKIGLVVSSMEHAKFLFLMR